MPNKETSFQSDGETYTMRFTTNALYKLEERLGKPFPRLAADLQSGNMGFRELQVMLWAGLEGHRMKTNPNKPVLTIEEVGNIADGAGGIVDLAEKVTDAFQRAFSKQEHREEGEKNSSENPTS